MDALALLCTLHADGPTTLRRLRDAGCGSLEELGNVSADRLAELLGVSPAAARRFLREAQSLADRLGGQDLEPEDVATPIAASAPSHSDHGLLSPTPPAAARGLDRTDRKVLERVIDRWREADERDAARSLPTAQRATLRMSPSERPDERAPEPELSHGTKLALDVIDGLDSHTARRLESAGCATVEELAAASALDLARESELPFTLVRRLQFLAQRVSATPASLEPAAPIPSRSHVAERFSPSLSAAYADRPTDESPAGPFA